PGVPYLEREPVYLRNTFNIEEELYETLMGHIEDYERLTPEVVEWEEAVRAEDTLLLVAHGIVGRAAKDAAERLQREGWPVGYFRPLTVRPFPGEALRKIVSANPELRILVVESAYGQLLAMVKAELYGYSNPLEALLRPGVGVTTEEIEETAKRLGKKEG
ncbi:MAG: ferredoxin oxidoreductase, partial [Firmicutes bacterium]|nr:ferredoxin oxidoreductase [Bacillota bacterium]